MLFSYSTPLGDGTNNKAEIRAAWFSLAWCIKHGYTKVILEVDSKLLYRWITRQADPPWKFSQTLYRVNGYIS